MEELLGIILVASFAITTSVAINFTVTDYRDFSNIVKQCEKQGFVQDKTIRVSCSVDK